MTAVVAASVVACASENGIVGGACAEGLTECGTRCVDLSTNASHCGACGRACSASFTCFAGACIAAATGTSGGGGSPAAGSAFASQPDAAGTVGGDAAPSSDGSTGNDGAASSDGGAASDSSTPSSDASSSPDDADADRCAAPNVDCGSVGCIDVRTSSEHCGSCDAFCASGRCVEGLCQGALAGHAVFIGHDYVSPISPGARLSSQERLLGNAALLAPSRAIRVVAIETFADSEAATNVRAILMRAAAESGRPLSVRTTNDVASLRRSDADVLVVHDQTRAAGRFAELASAARAPLADFLGASGVVIVLDGGSAGAEMISFASSAGLFDLSGHAEPTGLFSVDARDALGYGVSKPYAARPHATAFTLGEGAGAASWITVTDASGAPVVLHAVR